MGADCKLHAILDKNRVDCMIFCVIVNNSTYCHDATCVCKGRVKREINTHGDEAKTNEDGDQVQKLEEPTCEITYGHENYCPKTNSKEFPKKKTDLGNGAMNITQVTNLKDVFRKKSNLKYAKDKGNYNVLIIFSHLRFERVYNANKYFSLLGQFIQKNSVTSFL